MENKKREADRWYEDNANRYEKMSIEVSELCRKIIDKKGISYHSITYRLKEKESFLAKCEKGKYKDPTEEITDLSGVRIIAYTNQEVRRICDIIEKEFRIDSDNSANKADGLGNNEVGYLSVHYIVQFNDKREKLSEYEEFAKCKCEIQVRTLLQHAWAEIEHDKNYKFSGVLPTDIKRRFYLVAGVLEMMDREFDNLSKEIDEYAKDVRKKTDNNNYDIEINSMSLEQYLNKKFGENSFVNNLATVNEVVGELKRFGFEKISDIENAMTDKMVDLLHNHNNTTVGMLRDLMIYTDVNKYFNCVFQREWEWTDEEDVQIMEKNGLKEIRRYLSENNIEITPFNEYKVGRF